VLVCHALCTPCVHRSLRILMDITFRVYTPNDFAITERRVPGLCIRDCAGRPNNWVPRRAKLNTIDVKDVSVWCCFQDRADFVPFVTMSYAPTPPPQLFLDFSFKLFPGVASSKYVSTDDDDCFYYHSWSNNVIIASGTLSSFLT